MPVLQGQHLKPKYYVPIEDQLNEIFYEILFRPLIAIIDDYNAQISVGAHGVLNAADNALQIALRTGRVQYAAGVFSGHFNAAISRTLDAIGARYDAKAKVYRLAPISTPGWVKAEASSYQQTAKTAHGAILRQLDTVQENLAKIVDSHDVYAGRTLKEIQKDFIKSTEAIKVMPQLTAEAKERLAAEYTTNMKLWIKKFSNKMTGDLRKTVEKNAIEGYRFDELVDGIKSKYSVSKNKAKFLARQETALFMANYRKQRFLDAGVKRYIWRTSEDSRVRPTAETTGRARLNDHRDLDGQTFFYDHPPVVNRANGKRANPGGDYNCRCIDEPIIDHVA